MAKRRNKRRKKAKHANSVARAPQRAGWILPAAGVGLLALAGVAYSLWPRPAVEEPRPAEPDIVDELDAVLSVADVVDPLVSPADPLDDRVAKAAEILEKIPDEIPGAMKVEKYPVDGAKYVFAVCPQLHPVGSYHLKLDQFRKQIRELDREAKLLTTLIPSHLDETSPVYQKIQNDLRMFQESKQILNEIIETQLSEIIQSQKSIYTILCYLADHVGRYDLRPEATTSDLSIDEMAELWKITIRKPLSILENGKEISKNIHDHDMRFYPGAEFMLALNRGILSLQAEDKRLNDRGYDIIHNNLDLPEKERRKAIYDDRENFLVKLIASQENPFQVTKYGAAHNFSDTIAKWNAENSDRKISLVVITPEK